MFSFRFCTNALILLNLFSFRRLPKNLSGKILKQRSRVIKEQKNVARFDLVLFLTFRDFVAPVRSNPSLRAGEGLLSSSLREAESFAF